MSKLATEETFLAAYTGRRSRRQAHDHEILTFQLGDELYGLPIAELREICKLGPITELPRVPPFLLGVISLRGRVISIIDLRVRMHMPSGEATRGSRILIVEHDEEPFGLLVDRVIKVDRMSARQVEPAPEGLVSEFVTGVARTGGELVVLLDLAAVVGFSLEVAR